jgi:hypothetical protein
MSRVTDAVRKNNPGKFDALSDIELEAVVGAADPRYRTLIDQERQGTSELDSAKGRDARAKVAVLGEPTDHTWGEDFGRVVDQNIDTTVDMLPAAGGMLGGAAGLIGGPGGAIAGGAAGAGGGETLKQWIEMKRGQRDRYSPRSIALNTALGGLGEAAPLAGAKLFGRAFTKAVPPEVIETFPGMEAQALREGVTFTGKGAQQAATRAGQATEAADVAANTATLPSSGPAVRGPGGKMTPAPPTIDVASPAGQEAVRLGRAAQQSRKLAEVTGEAAKGTPTLSGLTMPDVLKAMVKYGILPGVTHFLPGGAATGLALDAAMYAGNNPMLLSQIGQGVTKVGAMGAGKGVPLATRGFYEAVKHLLDRRNAEPEP